MQYKYKITTQHTLAPIANTTYPNCDLFLFNVGGYTWAYTGGAVEVSLNLSGLGQSQKIVFSPAPLERSEVTNGVNSDKAQIKCNMGLEPIESFRGLSFCDNMSVWIIRLRNNGLEILLYGKVDGVEYDLQKGQATVSVTSMAGILSSKIPVRTFSSLCTHDFGSFYCGVDLDAYTLTLKKSECGIRADFRCISHPLIAARPDMFYAHGVCSAGANHAFIIAHARDGVEFLTPLYALRDDSVEVIKVVAGCDKIFMCCASKFGNTFNYGGYPFVPEKNPIMQTF